LPREWVVHSLAEDYGIDRRVEVFEDGRTTGIFFNVQLKSTDRGSGHQPAESIRRATLNYWEQTPDATLVVIGHNSTETLWYRWAHLLPYDENPDTKSRQVRCENVLDADAAANLVEEARAWRLARDLSRHLPIDLHVTGSALYGESATPLKRAIAQKLSSLPSFVRVVHTNPQLPYLRVSIEDTKVMAGLRGDAMRQITWGLHGLREYGALASDVLAALALSLANVGAEDLCVRLLKIAAPETHTLLQANGFGYAMALLTRHDAREAVLTLMRRTASQEQHPARDIALAAVSSSDPAPELRRAVAHEVARAARTWSRPATGLYNAANTLGEEDAEDALRLYEEAAQADPRYRKRGYWWREQGTVHWSQNRVEKAEEFYGKAIEYGDTRAAPLLADVLMRTGSYREAREAFEKADIWSSPDAGAQWRLSREAMEFIVEDLKIDSQVRPTLAVPDFFPPDTEDMTVLKDAALTAINVDALNGWAHATLANVYEDQGEQSIFASIAAAVTINVDPHLWLELLRQSLADRSLEHEARAAIGQDAMLCAWKYFGPSFADVILDEELIHNDALRAEVLDLFEMLRPTSPPFEMRQHSEDGSGYESFFIPTGPRATGAP
jgi:tetratricopeptide (TPR) repeat protein